MYCKDSGSISHSGVKWTSICGFCEKGKEKYKNFMTKQADTYINGLSGRANYAEER